MFLGFITIVLAFCADQLSKFAIDTEVVTTNYIEVCDYFNLVKVWNTGVSFSMFSNHGILGIVVLSAISLIVSAFLLYWMYNENNKLKIVSLGMIIGGAWGNVVDRIRFGAVLDFLDFHYETHHWPAFNLADTFICVGAFILILWELFYANKKGLNKI
ncbi:MAG: signal peptidase II [Alphaproteobacteria bacterium]|nr:signal peptidase II [Alphaproteobacteria bacterium]